MTWRERVVLDEPGLIREPSAHGFATVVFHKLAEIVGMDDVGFC